MSSPKRPRPSSPTASASAEKPPLITTHVVAFKMGESFTSEVAADAAAQCASFVGAIPGVLTASFGPTFTTEFAKGFTHVLVVTLDRPDRLETYGPHPAHQAWAGKFVTPHKSDIFKADIDAVVHRL